MAHDFTTRRLLDIDVGIWRISVHVDQTRDRLDTQMKPVQRISLEVPSRFRRASNLAALIKREHMKRTKHWWIYHPGTAPPFEAWRGMNINALPLTLVDDNGKPICTMREDGKIVFPEPQ